MQNFKDASKPLAASDNVIVLLRLPHHGSMVQMMSELVVLAVQQHCLMVYIV